MILTDPSKSAEVADQFVGKALTNFFCGSLGLNYGTVQGFHANGFGYGEIAQACFMAEAHGGDAAVCGSILNAKKTSDFSSLILQNGDTPPNWCQLKKDVLSQEIKSLTHLGSIVSGRALNCSDNNANRGNHNPHGGNPIINGGNKGHGNGNSGGTSHGQGHSPVMVIS